MLSLDSDEWGRLTHAYGRATDTPALLRALRSTDPPHDDKIWMKLAESLLHQGDIHPATHAAAPHLVDMLRGASLQRQVDVLTFVEPLLVLAPRAHADIGELLPQVRLVIAEVVRSAAKVERFTSSIGPLITVFLAAHMDASREFALPSLHDDRALWGCCPHCERPVHFVIEGSNVFEIESIDGRSRTPQRIVAPSRAHAVRDEARRTLHDDRGGWDVPLVFAMGALLAEEIGRRELAELVTALDVVIACARCAVEARLVSYG